MEEILAESGEKKEYYDYLGRVHPEGVPPYEKSRTGVVWPDLSNGWKAFEFETEVADVTYQFRLEPFEPGAEQDPAPEGFVLGKVLARIPDGRPAYSEEEQAWELVDDCASIPKDEDKRLRVFQELVANPKHPEEEQRGIRSHKLWAYLGGAGAVIGLGGIVVYRYKHKQPKS
jgi:hypothetical protein